MFAHIQESTGDACDFTEMINTPHFLEQNVQHSINCTSRKQLQDIQE